MKPLRLEVSYFFHSSFSNFFFNFQITCNHDIENIRYNFHINKFNCFSNERTDIQTTSMVDFNPYFDIFNKD